MKQNSIDWKSDEKLKGFLKTCVKKDLGREEILRFVARDFPQYGKLSTEFNIKYIKKETSIEKVKDAVKKELNGSGERLRYRAINQKLRMERDIKVPRDLAFVVMQDLDDEGLKGL